MSLSILSAQKLVPALLESFTGVIVGSCGEIWPSGRVIFMSGSGLGLGIGVKFSSPPIFSHVRQIQFSDWSIQIFLQSDWLLPQ